MGRGGKKSKQRCGFLISPIFQQLVLLMIGEGLHPAWEMLWVERFGYVTNSHCPSQCLPNQMKEMVVQQMSILLLVVCWPVLFLPDPHTCYYHVMCDCHRDLRGEGCQCLSIVTPRPMLKLLVSRL